MSYKAINKAEAKKALSRKLKSHGLGFSKAGILSDRTIAKADELSQAHGIAGDEVIDRIGKALDGDRSALEDLGVTISEEDAAGWARKDAKLAQDETPDDSLMALGTLQVILHA